MNAFDAYQVQKTRFMLWLEKHALQASSPLKEDGVDIDQLLTLCITKDENHNMPLHAIWFLEKYVLAHTADLPNIFNFLVANRSNITIEGARRILGNIYLQALRSASCKTTEEQDEQLISCGFDWLTTPGTSIAVLANSFELLYTLSLRHDWIIEALEVEISLLLERDASPAVRSRGQKVLKLLRQKPKRRS
ncbi:MULTISPECIES: hypothetical protein [Sphingobacterium]|uniref:Uncharacterized protein n=1 Tax=Sphingobacterium populi TaxID=1812824 RepID=A0ABW5UF77_9SPHI|nr:hypothetical protein [Sphingobacterium sp. CFCC 11742]